MTKMKFEVTPNLEKHREGHPEDIPIDSMNISNMLQAAGVDCEVQVDHQTGEVILTYGEHGVPNMTAAQKTKCKNLMRGMPQFIKEVE